MSAPSGTGEPGRDVVLRDVTLRDGLQDERPLPTDTKLAIFEGLLDAGVAELELCSFVRPDRVPAQADADVLAARTSDERAVRWALVLNQRGAERALAAGIDHLQYVLSVSEAHNLGNAGRTVEASLDDLERVCALAAEHGLGTVVEITAATSFGCPYTGPVDPGDVVAVIERALAAGVTGIGLADTIGTAIPTDVATLLDAVAPVAGDVPVGVHLHDTRGLAIANALTALEHGVRRFDGALGGLGGCPFAPGASGNLPIEDLAHLLDESGVRTGLDIDRLVDVATTACDAVGRPVTSHVGVAGRRFATLAATSTTDGDHR